MIPPTIRGDKSLFVAREYRLGVHQPDFQQRHPLLHQWITALSNTNQQQVEIFNQNHDADEDDDVPFWDINPQQDRLTVFRSDRVEHQVLPSLRRPRTVITLWFYGTITTTTILPTTAERRQESSIPVTPTMPPPLPINPNKSTTHPTIFVSIASYRDSETRPTLDALFATAYHPQRIVVGIVLQLQDGESYDERLWQQLIQQSVPHKSQIRYIRLHANDTLGPRYARGLAQTL
jgi:hypothetical protein